VRQGDSRSGRRRGRPKPRSRWKGAGGEITIFRRCRPYWKGLSGDSGIQERRATGATPAPATWDCDRHVDEVRGLPTVQSVKRGQQNTVPREEKRVTVKPLDKDCQWTMPSGGN